MKNLRRLEIVEQNTEKMKKLWEGVGDIEREHSEADRLLFLTLEEISHGTKYEKSVTQMLKYYDQMKRYYA